MDNQLLKKQIEKLLNVSLSDYLDEPAKVVKQLSNESKSAFLSRYGIKPLNYQRHPFKFWDVTLIVNVNNDKCQIEYMNCCEDYISPWFDMEHFSKNLVRYHNGDYDCD